MLIAPVHVYVEVRQIRGQTLLSEDFSHYFHSMLCLGLNDCGVLFMRVDFDRCEVEILRLKHDLF